VEYVNEKWGGLPHYRSVVEVIGQDDFGVWCWRPAGRPMYKGHELVFTAAYDTVLLVPAEEWWTLSWPFGHPRMTLYVNIGTPAIWEENRFVSIDLDLDVVKLLDGTALIVDEDEFEEHQVLYGYPDDVISRTRKAAEDALSMTAAGSAPFDGIAATAWAAKARAA
jgi:uncharacterized protein